MRLRISSQPRRIRQGDRVQILKVIREHIAATKEGQRQAVVTSSAGGHPLGAPPAIGATGWAGGEGFFNRGVTRPVDAPDAATAHILPAPRPRAVILADVFRGEFAVTRTNDDVWFAGQRPAQDIIGNRHTRIAVDSYASRKAWGSSDVASGPEGTLVLMPPRIPRALATRRAIQGARAGNALLNYANSHMETPHVTVIR